MKGLKGNEINSSQSKEFTVNVINKLHELKQDGNIL